MTEATVVAAKRQQARRLASERPRVSGGEGRIGYRGPLWVGLALLVVLALLVWGTRVVLEPTTLPITTVRLEGSFRHVSAGQLRAQVASGLRGGFFGVNVDALQRRVEQLPWVAHATVRRIWPDTVAIDVDEQQPLARWAAGGLVNSQGALFTPAADSAPANLPVLSGPPGSEALMSQRLRTVQALLQPLGLQVSQLTQDPRRAWSVGLRNGMELVLGREDSLLRLARFKEVWPRVLASREQDIARVDLRYTNGFAVRWKVNDAPRHS